MRTQLLVLLAFVGFATACSKDDEEPTIDFGPNNGFTMRTNTNTPTAQTDPTDWTHDATWNSTEQQLFASLSLSLGGAPPQVGSWYASAYPNPAVVNVGAHFTVVSTTGSQTTTLPTTLRVKLVVVDANYRVLDTADQLVGTAVTLPLQLPAATYAPDKLYRVYYVVYEPTQKTVYYRGHGDVKVER